MYSHEDEQRLKELHTTLYVVHGLGGVLDFHKIFKALYFADKNHLAKYGESILGDKYICMDFGPVPSTLYDRFKSLHGRKHMSDMELWKDNFQAVPPHCIKATGLVNKDFLSESEINCLNEAIGDCKQLSFDQLVEKSHDAAWNNTAGNYPMDPNAIAQAGGANEDMLKYIELVEENRSTVISAPIPDSYEPRGRVSS